MKTPPRKKQLTRIVNTALFAGLCCTAPQAFAADWNLSNIPLSMGNKVPANVLLLVDDSGSMDWEIMSKDLIHNGLFTGTQPNGTNPAGSGSIKNRDSDDDGTADCSVSGGGQSFYGYLYGVEFDANRYSDNNNDCNTVDDREWRFRNHDYNKFYFDPLKTYTPWPGTNADGVTPFGDMNVTSARANPWTGWRGGNETIDLTKHNSNMNDGSAARMTSKDWNGDGAPDGFRYYTWTDKDGDKLFDNNEETEHLVALESAAIKQNFANWFSYYRSRHLIAKAAFGRVISNINGLRVGLATLHNNGGVNTPLSLIDSTTTGEANRKKLLSNLYKIDPSNGTPLQNTLKQAGEYLSGKGTNTLFPGDTSAPLSVAQGGMCQQNFTLLMTDGFYNGSYDDGNINNADGDANSKYDSAIDKTPFPNYGDAIEKTLGDIAMYYYENDINTKAGNSVPPSSGDNAPHQHMVTFTVAFGVTGNLKGMPEEYADTKNAAWGAWPGWPTAAGNTADGYADSQRIDDLRHAAYNGRGEFLEADDPDSLVDSLNGMIGSIQNRLNSSSSSAFNTTSLRKNSVAFQAVYDSTDWHGELLYKPVATDGKIGTEIASAGAQMTTSFKDDASARRIVTINTDTGKGIPFLYTDLSTTQKAAVVDEKTVEYLRGEQGCEIGSSGTCATTKNQRARSSVLGDIVNSSPVYVGAPEAPYVSDPTYLDFIKNRATRAPVVYVGANDGMLHGFNATVAADGTAIAGVTGAELLAYVPGAAYKNLASLADPSYKHRFFVDATPVVGDAKLSTGWSSILVSGLRGGGQAVFALDVTNPDGFKDADPVNLVKWEFSDVDDADMGYTYGEPAIAKMADGSWAAVFGNGYNNTQADGNASTSGNAVLYVVNLETGDLIRKISTDVGMAQDPEKLSRPNGLSGVRVVDVDDDGVADFAYAGDLFGNLWRFDMTSTAPTGWTKSIKGFDKPLFVAKTEKDKVTGVEKMQSITVRPTVGPHAHGIDKGYMVYFGTGKFLEAADNSTSGQPTQTFYAVWDQWPKNSLTTPTKSNFDRTNLQPQEILAKVTLADGNVVRVTSNTPVNWDLTKGWFMDLKVVGEPSNNGERIINEALIRNGQVLFSTFVPNTADCAVGGGGYVLILDASTGSRPSLPPINLNNDGAFDEKDLVTATINGTATAYVASGYQSVHGTPSAPILVESEGGTLDYVAISYSDGTVGGVGSPRSGNSSSDTGSPNPLDALNAGILKGRVTWKRLK